MREPIRIVLVDDHEVVRVGLAGLLQAQPDFRVVGEAGSVAEAATAMTTTKADVVLMDIRLPDGSGIDVCRRWLQQDPDTRVIMLTSFGDDELLFAALDAGASGYLLKSARGRTLIDAIRTVADGGSMLDSAVADKVLRRRSGAHDPLDDLTEQERRVLSLIARGLTNRQIGQEVFLSEKTVKHYVSNILSKLGFSRRAEAAAFMARREAPAAASDRETRGE